MMSVLEGHIREHIGITGQVSSGNNRYCQSWPWKEITSYCAQRPQLVQWHPEHV